MRLAAICVILGLIAGPALAEAPRWSTARLEALFPEAPNGWTSADITVEELPYPLAEMEAMVGALAGSPKPPLVRLRLTRIYSADGRRIELYIDSLDISNAAVVDAAHKDEDTAADFAEKGFIRRQVAGMPALELVGEGQTGVLISPGSSGVVIAGCEYGRCLEDLMGLLAGLDAQALRAFAEAEHRSGGAEKP